MQLAPQAQTFVAHFGEMSSRWGFNRTVGQMLALLVVHPEPLNAESIAEALHISRGNVSMGIKELQSWRLVKTLRIQGDRKDYFTAAGSIWDLAKLVFEERRKREIDPTLSMLRAGLLSSASNEQDEFAQEKMAELLELLEHITEWGAQLNDLSPAQLKSLIKLGSGVGKVLNLTDRLTGRDNES